MVYLVLELVTFVIVVFLLQLVGVIIFEELNGLH